MKKLPYNCCDYLFHKELTGDTISILWLVVSTTAYRPAFAAYLLLISTEYILLAFKYDCQVKFWVSRGIATVLAG